MQLRRPPCRRARPGRSASVNPTAPAPEGARPQKLPPRHPVADRGGLLPRKLEHGLPPGFFLACPCRPFPLAGPLGASRRPAPTEGFPAPHSSFGAGGEGPRWGSASSRRPPPSPAPPPGAAPGRTRCPFPPGPAGPGASAPARGPPGLRCFRYAISVSNVSGLFWGRNGLCNSCSSVSASPGCSPRSLISTSEQLLVVPSRAAPIQCRNATTAVLCTRSYVDSPSTSATPSTPSVAARTVHHHPPHPLGARSLSLSFAAAASRLATRRLASFAGVSPGTTPR